ncbi:unnamed protein product [Alopecurus aequalis]
MAITPATSMNRSCSETSGSDDETHPVAGGKKVKPGVSLKLKKLLRNTPPEYLTLSLTTSSAHAAAAYRRPKRPGEVSLADLDAPRDYLSLSITPSDDLPSKCHGSRDVRGGGGSIVSSGAAEGAPVVMEALVLPPPPPVRIPAKRLPPKKRKLAAANPGEAPQDSSSRSRCLALAIVNHHHGVPRSSMPPSASGNGETGSPEAMSSQSQPIDAVPLQAVFVHGGVSHQFRLGSGTRATIKDAAVLPPEPAWIRETLRLAAEHQLFYIAGKRVQCSDMNKQQSRFMLPRGDINDRLVPLLTDDERRTANLHEAWERPKHEHGGEERPRVQGKVHRGLVVSVVINGASRRMGAELTRWDSSGSTVLKFGNAKGFVDESGLTKDDHIQIWAFRGSDGVHLVIAKVDDETAEAAPQAGGQQVA